MKSVRIYLDDDDGELISTIESMPKGERSARLKALLGFALAGSGGLLVRVAELERRVQALEDPKRSTTAPTQAQAPPASPAPTPPSVDAQKQKAAEAVRFFRKFGALDD